MNINQVNLSGFVSSDPTMHTTQNGGSVLSFSICVNENRKDKETGEWTSRPNFIDCAAFGGAAEWIGKIIHKGMKVAISGKLHYSKWDKDGQSRSKLEVIVRALDPLDIKKVSGGTESDQNQNQNSPVVSTGNNDLDYAAGGSEYSNGYSMEDIPF
jgi:single-strand DNA-binding protein